MIKHNLIVISKGRKVKKGYVGHAVKIANDIKQFGETVAEIKGYLNLNSDWENFVNTTLQPINDANNTEIGGPHPKLMLKGDYVIVYSFIFPICFRLQNEELQMNLKVKVIPL